MRQDIDLIGSAMDRKSISRIEFQKKRSNRRSDKRAGTRKGKQIEFWQNKLSTRGFNASKDLYPELRILIHELLRYLYKFYTMCECPAQVR